MVRRSPGRISRMGTQDFSSIRLTRKPSREPLGRSPLPPAHLGDGHCRPRRNAQRAIAGPARAGLLASVTEAGRTDSSVSTSQTYPSITCFNQRVSLTGLCIIEPNGICGHYRGVPGRSRSPSPGKPTRARPAAAANGRPHLHIKRIKRQPARSRICVHGPAFIAASKNESRLLKPRAHTKS
jgi:hypothetical protein